MSFLSDFFDKGGTGNTLVNTGGQLALGIVKNQGEQIQSDYQLKLKQLTNDASLSQTQFQVALAKLNAEKDQALASYSDEKRTDTMILVAIVGGLLLVTTISVLLILKSRKKQ